MDNKLHTYAHIRITSSYVTSCMRMHFSSTISYSPSYILYINYAEHFLLTPPPGARSGTSPWRRCITRHSARSLPGPLTWPMKPSFSDTPHVDRSIFIICTHSRGEVSYNLVLYMFPYSIQTSCMSIYY